MTLVLFCMMYNELKYVGFQISNKCIYKVYLFPYEIIFFSCRLNF